MARDEEIAISSRDTRMIKKERRDRRTHMWGVLCINLGRLHGTLERTCQTHLKPSWFAWIESSKILLVSGNSTPIVEHDVHTFSCNNWTSRRC